MRGAVLDFDGVLVRSMELHAEAYRRVLEPLGATPSDRDVFLLEGARSETLIAELLRRAGKPASPEEIRSLAVTKQKVFAGLGAVTLYPGARAFFDRVRAAVDRMGLVTGTRRENLERLVPELLPRFDAVLAQDAYTHDKPDPEPYRKAAEAIGTPPRHCCAVENAVRGVESARRAGYAYVVGITTTMGAEELRAAGAHAVVASHEAAASAVETWARSGL